MASIKSLKQDLNFVFGDIIEAVYVWEIANNKVNDPAAVQLIDDIIGAFDELIVKINDKKVANRGAHLKTVSKEMETKAVSFIEQLNSL